MDEVVVVDHDMHPIAVDWVVGPLHNHSLVHNHVSLNGSWQVDRGKGAVKGKDDDEDEIVQEDQQHQGQ